MLNNRQIQNNGHFLTEASRRSCFHFPNRFAFFLFHLEDFNCRYEVDVVVWKAAFEIHLDQDGPRGILDDRNGHQVWVGRVHHQVEVFVFPRDLLKEQQNKK